jgi:hypothetical protein
MPIWLPALTSKQHSNWRRQQCRFFMQNNNLFLGAVALLCLPATLQAKTLSYQWDTELCTYQAQYNSDQISKAQLDGSLAFTRLAGSVLLSAKSFVFEPAKISTLSLRKIDQDYQAIKAKLTALPVLPAFVALKQRTLARLEMEYATNRLEAQALLGQPQVLLTPAYGQASLRYAQMLNHPSAEQRLKFWDQIHEEHIRAQEQLGNTGYRKMAQQRHAAQKASNTQAYANIDFIQAWHNHLQWPDDAAHQQDTQTDWNRALIKAARFTQIQQECDEP